MFLEATPVPRCVTLDARQRRDLGLAVTAFLVCVSLGSIFFNEIWKVTEP